MNRPKQTFLRSFQSAFRGIGHVLGERNFVVQIILGVIALVLTLVLRLPKAYLLIVILLIAFVLSAEATNSACERALDVITKEHNPEIGRIKEILAGSVLISSIGALIIGILIFASAVFK